jgi:hypothetical protein
MTAKKKKDLGRITFAKNPWPKGHRIAELAWTGRVEADSVWFDLHLVSGNYDEDDKRSEDDGTAHGWRAKGVWTNYGSCTMSSTEWNGEATGFLVGTPKKPLDFAKLDATTFRVDPKPRTGDAKPAFHIYLTGHDAVADHQITFTRTRIAKQFSLSWKGRICLAYIGRTRYEHRFEAVAPRIVFAGFQPARGVSKAQARAVLAACVENG